MQIKAMGSIVAVAVALALVAGAVFSGRIGSAEAVELTPIEIALDEAHLKRPLRGVELRASHRQALAQADRLDLNVAREVRLAGRGDAGEPKLIELRRSRERLRAAIRRATRFPTPESLGVSQATLESIAFCESHGDPTAVSAGGDYRGKYQFHRGTWAAVGGSGDPAAASEREQDYRAALLYSRSSSSPWPICG